MKSRFSKIKSNLAALEIEYLRQLADLRTLETENASLRRRTEMLQAELDVHNILARELAENCGIPITRPNLAKLCELLAREYQINRRKSAAETATNQ